MPSFDSQTGIGSSFGGGIGAPNEQTTIVSEVPQGSPPSAPLGSRASAPVFEAGMSQPQFGQTVDTPSADAAPSNETEQSRKRK